MKTRSCTLQIDSNRREIKYYQRKTIRDHHFSIFQKSKIFHVRPRKHPPNTRKSSERPPRQGRLLIIYDEFDMVRSTLLQLGLRGALRAKSGGPPATLFFDLWTKVFPIKKGSRNKSFIVHLVSNHEESDGDRDFSGGSRHPLSTDHFWGHFCIIFNEIFEKSILHPSDRFKSQRN